MMSLIDNLRKESLCWSLLPADCRIEMIQKRALFLGEATVCVHELPNLARSRLVSATAPKICHLPYLMQLVVATV